MFLPACFSSPKQRKFGNWCAFEAAQISLINASSKKGGRKITPQNLISLANDDNAFVIDLRDSEQFQSGHITGSINIPFLNLMRSTVC